MTSGITAAPGVHGSGIRSDHSETENLEKNDDSLLQETSQSEYNPLRNYSPRQHIEAVIEHGIRQAQQVPGKEDVQADNPDGVHRDARLEPNGDE